MNSIEKLIAELCPDGVEYKELGDVLDYEQPTKFIVKSTAYDDDHKTPVLTAGQSFILGYTDEENGIYRASKDNEVVIFDDFTTSFHWVNFNFKVKSSAMKILKPNKDSSILFRYVFYAMKCITYKPQDHARQWISVYSKIPIPIPPLPIQQEIVSILDKFTTLEAELEAELEARIQQYEHYRNQLLTPVEKDDKWWLNGMEVEWMTMGEVGEFIRGKRFVKKDILDSGVPCIHYGEMYTHYNIWAEGSISFVSEEIAERLRKASFGDVVIVAAGETIEDLGRGVAWLNEDEDVVVHDACFIYKHKLNPKFISYYTRTKTFHSQIRRHISSGKISAINAPGLQKAYIPIPPLSEQERIVKILDSFDALVNDISVGLPAEIEARRGQYEYYRGKLLEFKEIDK